MVIGTVRDVAAQFAFPAARAEARGAVLGGPRRVVLETSRAGVAAVPCRRRQQESQNRPTYGVVQADSIDLLLGVHGLLSVRR